MVGGLFKALNLKPVDFKGYKAGLLALISTDSKMFSIYADGVVPGNRKETRTRIHAVVDFRTAQQLGNPMSGILGGSQPPPAPPPAPPNGNGIHAPPPGPSNNADPTQATPEAILAAMNSNPAGTIVYWRVE